MTDRERLIDIVYKGFYISPENDIKGTAQKAADYLIANGVTVQPQWISCEERLPERAISIVGKRTCPSSDEVLAYVKASGAIFVAEYWYNEDLWEETMEGLSISGVTHWMPLPEPPKGVE